MSAWARINATFFEHPAVRRTGWHGSLALLAAILMAKKFGWRGGKIRHENLTPDSIRDTLRCRDVSHRDMPDCLPECSGNSHCDCAWLYGIAQLVEAGLLIEDASHYQIKDWGVYQIDPNATERKRKSRASTHGKESRGVTDVTTTGRDGTYVRDGTETPPPPAGEPGVEPDEGSGNGATILELDTPSIVRPRDRQRLERIAEFVIHCGAGQAERSGGLNLRKRLKAGISDAEVAIEIGKHTWVTKQRLANFERGSSR